MANGSETGITFEKEPVYVDPSLIWRAGMGVAPTPPGEPIAPQEEPGVRPMIVDVEATGANPWDSRLICIGYKDSLRPHAQPECILDEDEGRMLIDFLSMFVDGRYNMIVTYNGAFDYRYIFAKMLYYRISCKEWVNVEIFDLMQVLQQVRRAFVYGYNKSGKLDDWMGFLLGYNKAMTFEDLLDAYERKDYPRIVEYNKVDVQSEFILYSLIKTASEQPFTGSSFAVGGYPREQYSGTDTTVGIGSEGQGSESTWLARCPECYSTYEVPITQPSKICDICGTTINMRS